MSSPAATSSASISSRDHSNTSTVPTSPAPSPLSSLNTDSHNTDEDTMAPRDYYRDFSIHHRSIDPVRDPDSLARTAGPGGRAWNGKQLTAAISKAWKALLNEGGEPAQIVEVERIRAVWGGGVVAAPAQPLHGAQAPIAGAGAVVGAPTTAADPAGTQTLDGTQAPAVDAGAAGILAGDAAHSGDATNKEPAAKKTGIKRARQVDMHTQTDDLSGMVQPNVQSGTHQAAVLANIPFKVMPAGPPKKKLATKDGRNAIQLQRYDSRFGLDEQDTVRSAYYHHHIRRHHGATGGWQHCYSIEGSATAATAILARTDRNHNVVDRVFVKDMHKPSAVWTDAISWSGDLYNVQTREPMELKMHKRLQALKPSSRARFSHVRSAKLWNDKRLFRMYINYCDRGDAMEYVSKVWSAKLLGSDWPRHLEPFLWHVLEQMCLACKTLRQGDQKEPGAPWVEIVHRDLKPQNVFLTTTSTRDVNTLYPAYPRVKIGDFGSAIETSKDDPFNPSGYLETGTRGYMATEQTEEFGVMTNEPVGTYQLGSHTNVFGIGATISAMMVDGRIPDHLGKATIAHPQGASSHSEYWAKGYSKDLMEIVKHCCASDPEERPSLDKLLGWIGAFVGSESGRRVAAHRGPGPLATAQAQIPNVLARQLRDEDLFRPGVVIDQKWRDENLYGSKAVGVGAAPIRS